MNILKNTPSNVIRGKRYKKGQRRVVKIRGEKLQEE
jgi:hypothetical protein